MPHFQYREDIYAHPCFQAFPKQITDDYLSNYLYGQEARKVFIQHPWFNIEVFLKKTKDGRSIIHRHWPKVAKTEHDPTMELSKVLMDLTVLQMPLVPPPLDASSV